MHEAVSMRRSGGLRFEGALPKQLAAQEGKDELVQQYDMLLRPALCLSQMASCPTKLLDGHVSDRVTWSRPQVASQLQHKAHIDSPTLFGPRVDYLPSVCCV